RRHARRRRACARRWGGRRREVVLMVPRRIALSVLAFSLAIAATGCGLIFGVDFDGHARDVGAQGDDAAPAPPGAKDEPSDAGDAGAVALIPDAHVEPSLSVGGWHACATNAAGGVRCWGANDAGQLGDDGLPSTGAPVDVTGVTSGASEVAPGWASTCA